MAELFELGALFAGAPELADLKQFLEAAAIAGEAGQTLWNTNYDGSETKPSIEVEADRLGETGAPGLPDLEHRRKLARIQQREVPLLLPQHLLSLRRSAGTGLLPKPEQLLPRWLPASGTGDPVWNVYLSLARSRRTYGFASKSMLAHMFNPLIANNPSEEGLQMNRGDFMREGEKIGKYVPSPYCFWEG